MVYTNFAEVVNKVRENPVKRVVAVAGAEDKHALEAIIKAEQEGLAHAVLLGNAASIRETLKKLDAEPSQYDIINVSSDLSPAQAAVELVKEGTANFLMKGGIETRDMLKPVVDRSNNLHTGSIMSHMAVLEVKNYPKLIVNTDGGMVPYPTLEEKKQILINTVESLHAMGYDNPKAAVICGVERINNKMPETLDGEALQKMAESGEISGCTVVGPISYDLAMSSEIARIKKYDCPHCGNFDILLAPNLAAGNIMAKCMMVTAGAAMAGIIVGARVPVVLSSRGAAAEEKFLSMALAALVSEGINL